MAILDTTYYRGTDLYSDGDEEENRILETVRAGKTLRDLGRDEVSWPMLYQTPFRNRASVLNSGSLSQTVTPARKQVLAVLMLP